VAGFKYWAKIAETLKSSIMLILRMMVFHKSNKIYTEFEKKFIKYGLRESTNTFPEFELPPNNNN
jgi:hypothetical protein